VGNRFRIKHQIIKVDNMGITLSMGYGLDPRNTRGLIHLIFRYKYKTIHKFEYCNVCSPVVLLRIKSSKRKVVAVMLFLISTPNLVSIIVRGERVVDELSISVQ
jgi:hypothetical protein